MKSIGICLLAVLIFPASSFAQTSDVKLQTFPIAHTYSIIAYDPASNQMGVAVQSHWFNVGSIVPWAEPGVGVVATQSLVEVSYGPLGLELVRAGKSAEEALRELLAKDENSAVRQVAMIDANGKLAVHTGEKCIPEAGHVTDEASNPSAGLTVKVLPKGSNQAIYSCQANLMALPTVPSAMAHAFETASGDLAHRMLSALWAAENKGGDIRGKQSAALVVVSIKPTGEYSADHIYDIRVDDSPAPLIELERLLDVATAYRTLNNAADFIYQGRLNEAEMEYLKMRELQPENAELIFWYAQTLVEVATSEPPEPASETPAPEASDVSSEESAQVTWTPTEEEREALIEMALPIFAECFRLQPSWRETLRRLVKVGLFPDDEELLQRILSQ